MERTRASPAASDEALVPSASSRPARQDPRTGHWGPGTGHLPLRQLLELLADLLQAQRLGAVAALLLGLRLRHEGVEVVDRDVARGVVGPVRLVLQAAQR